jgi:hypothetical protein
MLRNFSLACAIAACPTFNAAHAHHGLDFLLVQTAHLPEKGTGYAVADWITSPSMTMSSNSSRQSCTARPTG